jgi:uncharacterized protein YcsI (UPF0317 family)
MNRNGIRQLLELICQAYREGALSSATSTVLSGYSGANVIGLLQRLAKTFVGKGSANCLEVGVFKGG